MTDLRLYLAQRLSALIMAPLVLGHLAVMIYAVQNGLGAEEILARTRGSLGWAAFYGLFGLAGSVHAATGLRIIVSEVLGVRGIVLDGFGLAAFFGLLAAGIYAVVAVTMAP